MKTKIFTAAMSAAVLLTVLLITLLTMLPTSAQAQDAAKTAPSGVATNWKQIAIPALPPFKPQQPRRVLLPNGMIGH